ncbi:MAG: hypothetical protein GDA55_05030 [Cellvibrionales bacterium]|nr:hypothetical protein [Cellvibrionales bacterium]
MDIALAQLALVFLPGIIWATIDAKYGAGLKPSQATLLIRAFMFGVTTYAILYGIYWIFGKTFGYSAALDSGATSLNFTELADEIAFSVPLSLVLTICWLWIVQNRLLNKFLHKIKVTQRYGDGDVWSYALNSDDANVKYVHLRDLENDFVFAGWVNAYSEEAEDFRELLLTDVVVYGEHGQEVSRVPFLYLSRPKHNIWVEFPYRAEGYENA